MQANFRPILAAFLAAGLVSCASAEVGVKSLGCGENPPTTERFVFISLPPIDVEPHGKPFVDKDELMVCENDHITWFGPEGFSIEWADAKGKPVDDEKIEKGDPGGNGDYKRKIKAKVKKTSEKYKPYKYTVKVPDHEDLDPKVIISNGR